MHIASNGKYAFKSAKALDLNGNACEHDEDCVQTHKSIKTR